LSLALVEIRSRVALIRLNHPPANSLNPEMIEALHAALDQVESTDCKVIVLITDQEMFAAGADLKAVHAMLEGSEFSRFDEYVARFNALLLRLERLPCPVIASINGHTLGGGLELAMACDIRVAVDNPQIRIGLPEVKLGVIPAIGGTQRIARIVGRSRALDMLLTGRFITTKEAYDWGLIQRLCSSDRLHETVLALAHALSSGASAAQAAVKRCVIEGADQELQAGLRLEQEAIRDIIRSADAREGVLAFVEKRKPQFQ